MRKGIKLLLALTCIWLIGYIITNYLLVWNVFDEIYYSRYGMKIFRPNCASYENMSQWEGLSRDDERIFYSDGFFKNYYQEEYLGENAYLIIYLNKKRKVVEIGYLYEYEDFNEIYDYTYDVRKKCLSFGIWHCTEDSREKMSIDLVDEEKKQYFYERFLTDWFEANEGKTRFSLDDLGLYKYVE